MNNTNVKQFFNFSIILLVSIKVNSYFINIIYLVAIRFFNHFNNIRIYHHNTRIINIVILTKKKLKIKSQLNLHCVFYFYHWLELFKYIPNHSQFSTS